MLRLDMDHKPYDIDLGSGVVVHVRPYDNMIRLQAMKYMTDKVVELSDQYTNCKDGGLSVDHLPDMDDEHVRLNLSEHFFTIGRGVAGIISWSGVIIDDEGTVAPVVEEWVSKLFTAYPTMQNIFHGQYLGAQEIMAAEKNGLGTAPDTSSEPVPSIAKAAKRKTRRAVANKKVKTGNIARK